MGAEALTSRILLVNRPIIYGMPLILDPTRSSTKELSNLISILQSCIKLIRDQKALEELQCIFKNYGYQVSGKPIEKTINQV